MFAAEKHNTWFPLRDPSISTDLQATHVAVII